MGTPGADSVVKFKVGDKVRRKGGDWYTPALMDKDLTVHSCGGKWLRILEHPGGWSPNGFDLVQSTPSADTASYPDNNPKTVIGLTKPPIAPIPPVAILHLGQAMSDGRRKYGLMNWREKTVSSSVYYDAAMRHLMAWWDGEDKASDSGVHHLGHAMACMSILLDAEASSKLNDDRPFKGVFSDVAAAMTKKAA